MNYGFLIDNRKCIGCHACSTACKAENEVPLGVHRTWVKHTERGVFPQTRRFFQVTRCNHCAHPPCVAICPVTAMFQRADGIVEFDPERCIGCKACLQACPYDAIYIDPETHTAAKCHFCAHRVDVGLEPACVVVCPEHAILAGDLDDPASEIARVLTEQPVRVRRPEQGTLPKLFYIDGDEGTLEPGFASQDAGMAFAQWPRGGDWRGPIHIGEGRMAAALLGGGDSFEPARAREATIETYAVAHRVPWHWQVPAYLVAKAIGAGVLLVAAPGTALGWLPATPLFTWGAALLALLFIGLNTAFLVWDLDRPERFFHIVLRPQWRSWLTRGAFVLIGYTLAATAYGALAWAGALAPLSWLAWPTAVLALLSAVYSAFLFAQAEGRDLWQGKLVGWHLAVQAVMAGAAALVLCAPGFGAGGLGGGRDALRFTLLAACGLNLALTLLSDLWLPQPTRAARVAASLMTHGRYRLHFWASVAAGALAAALLLLPTPIGLGLASGVALLGLLAYEWAFVMAPQQLPNS